MAHIIYIYIQTYMHLEMGGRALKNQAVSVVGGRIILIGKTDIIFFFFSVKDIKSSKLSGKEICSGTFC